MFSHQKVTLISTLDTELEQIGKDFLYALRLRDPLPLHVSLTTILSPEIANPPGLYQVVLAILILDAKGISLPSAVGDEIEPIIITLLHKWGLGIYFLSIASIEYIPRYSNHPGRQCSVTLRINLRMNLGKAIQ